MKPFTSIILAVAENAVEFAPKFEGYWKNSEFHLYRDLIWCRSELAVSLLQKISK